MNTVKLTFKNEGSKAIAVPYHGGTKTILAGEKETVDVPEGYLTDKKKALLERLDVKVTGVKTQTKEAK
ncbi:MAG: hypothetical protein AAF709_08410 [Pseudomonadota bacterium]